MNSNHLDIDYLCSNDQTKVSYFKDQDIAVDDLLTYSKDLFELLDDLNLDKRDLCEFLLKLKIAHDFKKGKPVSDLLLYENDHENPTRISIEDRLRSITYFFKRASGQTLVDKPRILFLCETCNLDTPVTILQVKDHIRDCHSE